MLDWLESHSAAYWAMAWTLFGLLVLGSAGGLFAGLLGESWQARMNRFAPRWLFVALLAVTFFAFRWPAFFHSEEMNPDESQIIAGAITLQHDPIFWRSVDGTTHGPFDDYPLLLARLVGQPINYLTARAIGALLILGSIFLLYRSLARYFPEAVARVACLPAVAFFAFSTYWDFIHYSSEHMPVFLLSAGFYCLCADLSTPDARRTRSWRWFAAGIALGASPLAKLQSTPIAAALLVAGTFADLMMPGIATRDRFRRLWVLAAGAALVPALQVIVLLVAGELSTAWNSYFVQNVYYAASRHLTQEEALQGFWHYVGLDPGYAALTYGCSALLAVAWLGLPRFPRATLRLLALGAIFLAATLLAVLAPGRQYAHYLLLSVIPGTLLVGALFCAWWQVSSSSSAGETRVLLLFAFLAAGLWPQVQSRLAHPNAYLNDVATESRRPLDAVSREILRYAQPGEALGHWGWMCRYYVYTGLRQATREAHTVNLIQYSPLQEYYRRRYLEDLNRNRPPVFIDAVGPGNFVYGDRVVQAHETFPALRDYVDQHYRQVADLNGTRIYVRNDRQAQP